MKLILAIGAVLISAGIGLNVWTQNAEFGGPHPSVVVPPPPAPSGEFAGVEKKLGLEGQGRRIFRQTLPVCSAFKEKGQQGEYREGRIIVTCDEQVTLFTAHEYLHAVWEKTDKKTRASLSRDLWGFYQANNYIIQPRFEFYRKHGFTHTEITNELHSVFGTEMNRYQLSPKLQDWYAKWLPNPLPALCC